MINAMTRNDGIIIAQKTMPSKELLIVLKIKSPKHWFPAGRMRVENQVASKNSNATKTSIIVVRFFLLGAVRRGGLSARLVISRPKTMWNQPIVKITVLELSSLPL